MTNITYITGDLFELAPDEAYLAHACNCQGVWGSGVAIEFRKRFPEAYVSYVKNCTYYKKDNLGLADVFGKVVCLYTSIDYGKNKCKPKKILESTLSALTTLKLQFPEVKELHMPKINSGLFAVPWEDTENILLEFPEIKFYVYELEKT